MQEFSSHAVAIGLAGAAPLCRLGLAGIRPGSVNAAVEYASCAMALCIERNANQRRLDTP
jgi:hypothetical protein